MHDMAEKVKTGMPLEDVDILDCHCHIGPWRNFNIPGSSVQGLLQSMDALGMNTVCITAHAAVGPDFRYGNDIVIDAVSRYPGRFLGYVTLNPNAAEELKAELERCFAVKGMMGIKLHPAFHGCPVYYKGYGAAYRAADEKGCPVLIHVWGSENVADVDKLAGEYKNARFIMGHAGGTDVRVMEKAIDVVNRHDNVFADLALSVAYEGNVEWLVRETGSEKILFGTDMPFYDPRPTFGRLAMADISDADRRNIFGLNMKRLISPAQS